MSSILVCDVLTLDSWLFVCLVYINTNIEGREPLVLQGRPHAQPPGGEDRWSDTWRRLRRIVRRFRKVRSRSIA